MSYENKTMQIMFLILSGSRITSDLIIITLDKGFFGSLMSCLQIGGEDTCQIILKFLSISQIFNYMTCFIMLNILKCESIILTFLD